MQTASQEANDVAYILQRPYTRKLEPQPEGGFVASILEFPGCIAEGETPDEAYVNLEKAAAAWIMVSLESGRDIKPPINYEGFSGRVALRMPRTLHKQSAEFAELEGISINQFLVFAISEFIGQKTAFKHSINTIKELISQQTRRPVWADLPMFYREGDANPQHAINNNTDELGYGLAGATFRSVTGARPVTPLSIGQIAYLEKK